MISIWLLISHWYPIGFIKTSDFMNLHSTPILVGMGWYPPWNSHEIPMKIPLVGSGQPYAWWSTGTALMPQKWFGSPSGVTGFVVEDSLWQASIFKEKHGWTWWKMNENDDQYGDIFLWFQSLRQHWGCERYEDVYFQMHSSHILSL